VTGSRSARGEWLQGSGSFGLKQAIEIAKKKKNIHLLLTDVIMPTMVEATGRQICKLRRDESPFHVRLFRNLVAKHGIWRPKPIW
jgi:CheY-like chemotaxis protein